jgi:hypothetical protein
MVASTGAASALAPNSSSRQSSMGLASRYAAVRHVQRIGQEQAQRPHSGHLQREAESVVVPPRRAISALSASSRKKALSSSAADGGPL